MLKLLKRLLVTVIIANLLIPPGTVFAQSASDAMVDLGKMLYNRGQYQDALQEFNKALVIDPANERAIQYIRNVRAKQSGREEIASDSVSDALDAYSGVEQGADSGSTSSQESRAEVIRRELDKKYPQSREPQVPEDEIAADNRKTLKEKTTEKRGPYVAMTGDMQMALGIEEDGDVIWKNANADLNERNWRIAFGEQRYNTYDPAVFSRFKLNLDTQNLDQIGWDNFDAHLQLVVDPWSFTGKSESFPVTGAWGNDEIDFQLLYWSNTGATINQTFYSNRIGDSVGLPELKLVNGYTPSITKKGKVTPGAEDTFVIPAQKINVDFQPVRELWFDYKDDTHKFRFFPLGYQDQALTTDDPLMLSNKKSWWEESQWLVEWAPGSFNSSAVPVSFRKGAWDDTLAFFTRDSDNLRLTALRGFSFGYQEDADTLLSTFASPKNLWADYENFETDAVATRYKHEFLPNFGMGLTHTGHFGFNENALDALNNVFAFDAKVEPVTGMKLSAEVATSKSAYDTLSEGYATRKMGNAYLFAMENRFPEQEIYGTDFGMIRKDQSENGYLKSKFRVARIDAGFDPSLSSFANTHNDAFWSRHITFRKHPTYFYTGDTNPMSFDDIKAFAIGDGLDSNRNVIGWRLEGQSRFFDRNLEGLFDVRNVHETDGGFKENVSRLEFSYDATDRLKAKALGVRTQMPKTEYRVDPYTMDPLTKEGMQNTAIDGGDDPSLSTLSTGFDYQLTDKLAWNVVYEYTNDSILATGNYPAGLFNDTFYTTYNEYGRLYSKYQPFLYNQQYFDTPPYDYFTIYKTGFDYRLNDQWDFYLDYTLNENKKSGQIDDNMNHYGAEVSYQPMEKLSFLFRYSLARWIDLNHLNDTGEEEYRWHHNCFFSSKYLIDTESEFIFDYGVGGISPVGSMSYDPFGGALLVLDTQHLIRLYYKRKF